MKKITLGALVLTTGVMAAMLDAPRAEACGGCFVPPTVSESTQVTDHRMALSISTQQTVLWDQIRYSGDPKEFAWVLPVRAGAKLELANDEFFNALDSSTQPTVVAPNTFGGAAGCALTGCSSSESADSMGSPGVGEVQVLNQSVVGPYETVTLRATDDDALTKWLVEHQFAIPTTIEPTISAYVSEGFDFIALRLRPQCSERSMQPVRVVSPGADPTLPLRMVAAGVGAKVGITLWVITEGRYEPQNFPYGFIEEADLRWDRFAGRSNYQKLSEDKMAERNGFTWIMEYANIPQLPPPPPARYTPFQGQAQGSAFGGVVTTIGLTEAYYQQCKYYRGSNPNRNPSSNPNNTTPPITPCPEEKDAGNQNQSQDSGVKDSGASTDAGDAGDAGTIDGGGTQIDAGSDPIDPDPDPKDSGTSSTSGDPCAYLDDLNVAISGLHRNDIWVTRLRSTLPVDALKTGDLRLQPSKEQKVVSHIHYARYYADDDPPSAQASRDGCGSAPKEHRAYGSWIAVALSAIFSIAAIRRRRRR